MVVRRKDKKVEATDISFEGQGLTLSTTGQFNRCRLVIVEFASSRDETRRDGQRLIVASRHARLTTESENLETYKTCNCPCWYNLQWGEIRRIPKYWVFCQLFQPNFIFNKNDTMLRCFLWTCNVSLTLRGSWDSILVFVWYLDIFFQLLLKPSVSCGMNTAQICRLFLWPGQIFPRADYSLQCKQENLSCWEGGGDPHHLLPGHRVALAAHGRVHQVHHAPLLLRVTQGRRPWREVGGGGHHRQPPASHQDNNFNFTAVSKSSTMWSTTVTRPTAGQLLTTVAPSRPNACATFPAPPSERPPVGSRSAGAAGIGRPAAHRPSSPASHFRGGRSSLLPEESSRQNLFLALNIHQLVPELIS